MMRRFIRTITPQAIIDLYRARHEAEGAANRIDAAERQFVRERCPAGCEALDIGAGAGAYTWLLRDLADRVHTFEPHPVKARRLRRAFLRDDKVQVHQVALSDRSGEATLRLRMHVPVADRAHAAGRSESADPSARAFRVRLRRLDEWRFARRVGFVKIDADGNELAVLEGAIQTLQAHRPVILIEIGGANMGAVIDLLRQLGYRGSFGFAGKYLPIEAFDEERHQPVAAPDTLRQVAGTAPYVSNFMFTADA